MATDGYKDVGYQYVSIDDCWLAKERDINGRLQPDKSRFPSGIKALADYVSISATMLVFVTHPLEHFRTYRDRFTN